MRKHLLCIFMFYFLFFVVQCFANENYYINRMPVIWQGISYAKFSPLQLSILNARLFDTRTPIYGLNINLGVSFPKHVSGLSIGTFNFVGTHNGMMLLGIVNFIETTNGIKIACLLNEAGKGWGSIAPVNVSNDRIFQIGIVNSTLLLHRNQPDTIFQVGLWNMSPSGICQIGGLNIRDRQNMLLQMGLVNSASENKGIQIGVGNGTLDKNKISYGCQIGIFNAALNGGVQIGLLNYNEKALLSWFPFFNFSFPSDNSEEEK